MHAMRDMLMLFPTVWVGGYPNKSVIRIIMCFTCFIHVLCVLCVLCFFLHPKQCCSNQVSCRWRLAGHWSVNKCLLNNFMNPNPENRSSPVSCFSLSSETTVFLLVGS